MVINHINKMTVKDVESIRKSTVQGKLEAPAGSLLQPPGGPSKSPSTDGGGEADNKSIRSGHSGNTYASQQPTTTTKTSKKMYFIVSLIVYSVICFLFFAIDFGIWLLLCFFKMKYFIRQASFFNVVPDVYWMVIKFLVGSMIHFFLSILVVLVLVGVKRMEQFILKHQERLMMWLTIIACVAEYYMFSGSIEYLSSSPTVMNGDFFDTVLPPLNLPSAIPSCLPNQRPRIAASADQIRVNLKWLMEVSCVKSDGYVPPRSAPTNCLNYRNELISLRDSDCVRGEVLRSMMYTMLSLDCLGLLFCCSLFYLYARAVVRTSPARYSFLESTYPGDIEALRSVADRVKRHTTINLNKNQGKNVVTTPAVLVSGTNSQTEEIVPRQLGSVS